MTIFKYSAYRVYLRHLTGIARVTLFRDHLGASPTILLRHDVDFSIDLAHALALQEFDVGIRSTFFIMTTSPCYNVFTRENSKRIHSMAEMGFEIGLHFDPCVYPDASDMELANHVEREAGNLAAITGAPVQSISLHNPSMHGQYPMFEGYKNAYDPAFFSDGHYMSDSRMDFRGNDPYVFAEKAKSHTIQILLHPLHFSEEGHSYRGIFHNQIQRDLEELDHVFRPNNSTFASDIPKGLFALLGANGGTL